MLCPFLGLLARPFGLGSGLTLSKRDTASLNSNGIGGISFVRGIVQGETVTRRAAATTGSMFRPWSTMRRLEGSG